MAFEFLSSMDTTTIFLLLIIFILAVLSMKKIFSLVMNAVFIGVASILIPVIMNRFFGFDIPIDRDSMISFVLLGLGIYFVYLVGRSLYKVLGMAERTAKKVPLPKMERKPKEEPEEKEDKSEVKKKEKELKEREKELASRERQARFTAAIQNKQTNIKKKKDDYVTLKDEEPRESHIEPLREIKHKKKKKE